MCVTFASSCNSWPIIYFSSLATFQITKTPEIFGIMAQYISPRALCTSARLSGLRIFAYRNTEPIQKAKPKPAAFAGVTQLNIDSVIKYKLQIGNNHRKQTSPPQAAPLWQAVDPSCVKSSHGSASYCNDDNSRISSQTNRHPNSLERGPCPLGKKWKKI